MNDAAVYSLQCFLEPAFRILAILIGFSITGISAVSMLYMFYKLVWGVFGG